MCLLQTTNKILLILIKTNSRSFTNNNKIKLMVENMEQEARVMDNSMKILQGISNNSSRYNLEYSFIFHL